MNNPFSVDTLEDARHDIRWHSYRARQARAVTWSLIGAHADGFCFNYGYLVRFLQRRNETCGWGGDPHYYQPVPIPSPLEFLQLLEFREEQLTRAINNSAAEWSWPNEWGEVPWNGPIVSGAWAADGSKLWNLNNDDLAKLKLVETRNGIMAHKLSLGLGSPAASTMGPLARLDMTVGAELQAAGGILDRLDYRRVRRLGVQLRNIPKPSDDWDLPPSSLLGWIASFEASIDSLRVASESGLLRLLQSHADDIRTVLSLEIIPAIDQEIAGLNTLDELITLARDHDRLKDLDFEKLQARLPSNEDLARILVVQLGVSVPWPERPKLDEPTGLKRLKLGALLGQVALGGALAVGNLAFGVVGGIITSVPGITNSIPLSLGLVGSTYTGFNGLLSGIDKLTDALKK